MCSYSEFKELLSRLAASSSPVGRASALAECQEALDVWQDKALDSLVSRADLLREVCVLREQLHDARTEYLALWDLSLAATAEPERPEFPSQVWTCDRCGGPRVSDRDPVHINSDGEVVHLVCPDGWDDVPEPSFSVAFAAELVARMDQIMSTQEATTEALARLGAIVEDEAGW